MTKYSLELKLEAVLAYLEGVESFQTVASRFCVKPSPLKNWVAHYKKYGVEGLVSTYTNYDIHFKMDVLNYMTNTGASYVEAATTFRIPSPQTVWKWKHLVDTEGVDALQPKVKGRPTMNKQSKKNQPVEGSEEALRAEIESLRMENAYLKKLQALIQEKEKLQTKIKRK